MGLLCSSSSNHGGSLLWSSSVYCCLWALMMMNVGMYVVRGKAITPQVCDPQTSKPCQAVVGYKASANFNLSHVASLFSLNYTSLLGPNDIDPSLPNLSGLVLPPLPKPYLIPQSCGCSTGGNYITSTNYTVVDGDTLSIIATQFLDFATYQEIANVSHIPNPDQILPGQNITIPIPCACLNASNSVISLSYQLQQEDSLSKIAQEYNTSTQQLQALNSIANDSQIEANQVLFVPLPVCKANFSRGALDGNLTVVEGAYELTADGCVQCNCNNGSLRCIPTASSALKGGACSNVTCSRSSLTLGASNPTQSSQGCSVQSCVYKGYTTQSGILSSLEVEQDLDCPAAPAPETFYKPPTGLVAAPLASPPPPTTSTSPPPSSSPPPPPPATPTSNPNSATPLRNFFGWSWCLLVPGLLIMI